MPPTENRRLVQWQIATIALMVFGYAGYYLCRSNFSVTLPQIIEWLGTKGVSPADAKVRLGTVASIGTLAYACGKFLSGGMADFFGGRRNFLLGMGGAILFTALFTLAWVGNRLVQSMGWVGMVKITSRWFSNSVYGTAMGAISLSYLFGDAASRKFMAYLIERGNTWQNVFFIAASILAVTFVITFFFLKESPTDLGLPEPEAGDDTLYKDEGGDTRPQGLAELLRPFLSSPTFWCVCLISLGFTLIRETFNTWTPTYFQQVVGMTKAQAAAQSAYFPLWGGVSVLIAGFLSDKLGKGGRAAIIAIGIALSGLLMYRLGHMNAGADATTAALLVSCIAFLMLGPYSYLAGAIALDFGGKKGSATACGIIDGVGYLAGVLAGDSVARISVKYGWQGAFTALSGVAALACLAALAFWFFQKRSQNLNAGGAV